MDPEKLKRECLESLNAKLSKGTQIFNSYRLTDHGTYESSFDESYLRIFVVTARHEIERISSGSRVFVSELPQMNDSPLYFSNESRTKIAMIVGTLTALREAIVKGHLESLESKIRANIHDDILQQARTLLNSRYHIAAMVLVGGVLENHLQKLCNANSLSWAGDGTIGKFNDLLKEIVIPQPKWRRIQSIGDDRNHAAHGEYEKVDPQNVDEHHKFVERLIEEFPA